MSIDRLKVFTFLPRAEIEELEAARRRRAVPARGAAGARARGDDARARRGCDGCGDRRIRGALRPGRPGGARCRHARVGARRAAERATSRPDDRWRSCSSTRPRLEPRRGAGARSRRAASTSTTCKVDDEAATSGRPRSRAAVAVLRRGKKTLAGLRHGSARSSHVPFTPSHAVVALPFLRTPLVPAAIAVGRDDAGSAAVLPRRR